MRLLVSSRVAPNVVTPSSLMAVEGGGHKEGVTNSQLLVSVTTHLLAVSDVFLGADVGVGEEGAPGDIKD